MAQHRIMLVLAGILLVAGAVLIISGLCRRSSRRGLALARDIAIAEPVPVPEVRGPNPARPKRAGRPGQQAMRELLDGSAWAAVDAAAAVASATTRTAWPYAMLVNPDQVAVLLAGTLPPEPPSPWQEAECGWAIDRRLLVTAGAGGSAHPSDTFVALGSGDSGAILLDLARAPTVISATGDQFAARDLLRSVVRQLLVVPRNRVLVAPGFLPGAPEATPAQLLDRLGHRIEDHAGTETPWTFVVCDGVTPAVLDGLRFRAAAHGRLRVLVLGEATGSRWSLLVSADGYVVADGLGLAASSRSVADLAPLSRSLEGHEPNGAVAPGRSLPALDDEEGWPSEDDETWASRVALASPVATVSGGLAHLAASDRAFFTDELQATLADHPALALVSARDPRLASPPSGEPPAEQFAAGEEPAGQHGDAHDPVLGLHPALASPPERDPGLRALPVPGDADLALLHDPDRSSQ